MATLTDNAKKKLYELHQKIESAKKELTDALKESGHIRNVNYTFTRTDGSSVTIAELFGDHDDLLLVHNMGKGCVYCTLWADGFTGYMPHLTDRTAFALATPDDHETAREFSDSRGWNFPVVSAKGTTINDDMGFGMDGKVLPGASSFHRNEDGSVDRIAMAHFGPGDDFCPVWPLLDLLKDGANGWEPKFNYD